MKIVLTGPPGAGKGTQAERIAQHYDIEAISTGALFRQNIAEQTPLGRQISADIAEGNLVSDQITNAVVADRLAQPDVADGWLLDGYPRSAAQVEALDELLGGSGIDAVIALVANPDDLVGRLLKRAAIEGRADDNEASIRNRMRIYDATTEPVLAIYRERGQVIEVDAIGAVDEVSQRIFTALERTKADLRA